MKEKLIEINDFILEETEIKTSIKIDSKAKLSDFVNIKIPLVDPTIGLEIKRLAENVRGNVASLRNLLNG